VGPAFQNEPGDIDSERRGKLRSESDLWAIEAYLREWSLRGERAIRRAESVV